jgi:hypothetical protein
MDFDVIPWCLEPVFSVNALAHIRTANHNLWFQGIETMTVLHSNVVYVDSETLAFKIRNLTISYVIYHSK